MRASPDRVVARFLEARADTRASLEAVDRLVGHGDFEGATKTLLALLRSMDVYAENADRVLIRTEWLHAADQEDEARFKEFVGLLVTALERMALFEGADEDRRREARSQVSKLLALAEADAAWVDTMSRGQDDAFTHGPFQVILTSNAGDKLQEALEALDKASSLVKRKFPQVLYGKVYVRNQTQTRGTYGAAPSATKIVAGSYVAAGDFINLSLYATPDRNSVQTLIHELGHRYQNRFLSHDQEIEAQKLWAEGSVTSEVFSHREREKIAEEWLAVFKKHQQEEYVDGGKVVSPRANLWANHSYGLTRDEMRAKVIPHRRKFIDDKDDSAGPAYLRAIGRLDEPGDIALVTERDGPQYASAYGETDWKENFAEAFLAVVAGTPLPKGLAAFMASL